MGAAGGLLINCERRLYLDCASGGCIINKYAVEIQQSRKRRSMNTHKRPANEPAKRILVAFLFVTIGALIMIVFSPWDPLLGRGVDYLGRLSLIILLSLTVFLLQRGAHSQKYWQVVFGLLILVMAVSFDWISGIYLIEYVGIQDTTPSGWAILKLNECVVVVGMIVLLTWLSRGSLGSIYIQKGNLKLGLSIGLITFVLAAAGSIPMATLFNAKDLNLARIIPWIPWVLIFVLANAVMEEIMFRGLFLRKLEPFCGAILSNVLVAFVFTVMHGIVTYTADQYIFLAVLFPLALSWGYLMQRTDAVWASILFHAGMDIPIMLGIFSNRF
jgi:membrane protease YdiL (CAAX protease family)